MTSLPSRIHALEQQGAQTAPGSAARHIVNIKLADLRAALIVREREQDEYWVNQAQGKV